MDYLLGIIAFALIFVASSVVVWALIQFARSYK